MDASLLPVMLLPGSPGPLELVVLFAVILVLFGPRKLPEIARSIGRALSELRRASEEFGRHVMSIEESESPVAPDVEPVSGEQEASKGDSDEDVPPEGSSVL